MAASNDTDTDTENKNKQPKSLDEWLVQKFGEGSRHVKRFRKFGGTKLQLYDQELAGDEVVTLATVLSLSSSSLSSSSLSSSSSSAPPRDEGTEAEAELVELNLSFNAVGDDGAVALAESKVLFDRIRKVNLSSNHIGPRGCRALAHALSLVPTTNTTTTAVCQSLDLRINEVGDEGAMALSHVLSKLQKLDLNHNDITDDGAVALARGLSSSSSTTECRLQSLDLSGNRIGEVGVRALLEALPESSLEELLLEHNATEVTTTTTQLLAEVETATKRNARLGRHRRGVQEYGIGFYVAMENERLRWTTVAATSATTTTTATAASAVKRTRSNSWSSLTSGMSFGTQSQLAPQSGGAYGGAYGGGGIIHSHSEAEVVPTNVGEAVGMAGTVLDLCLETLSKAIQQQDQQQEQQQQQQQRRQSLEMLHDSLLEEDEDVDDDDDEDIDGNWFVPSSCSRESNNQRLVRALKDPVQMQSLLKQPILMVAGDGVPTPACLLHAVCLSTDTRVDHVQWLVEQFPTAMVSLDAALSMGTTATARTLLLTHESKDKQEFAQQHGSPLDRYDMEIGQQLQSSQQQQQQQQPNYYPRVTGTSVLVDARDRSTNEQVVLKFVFKLDGSDCQQKRVEQLNYWINNDPHQPRFDEAYVLPLLRVHLVAPKDIPLNLIHNNNKDDNNSTNNDDKVHVSVFPQMGPTLADRLARQVPSSFDHPSSPRIILSQVAKSLQHIHARGKVHGDVRPETIVFCNNNNKVVLIHLDCMTDANVNVKPTKPQSQSSSSQFVLCPPEDLSNPKLSQQETLASMESRLETLVARMDNYYIENNNNNNNDWYLLLEKRVELMRQLHERKAPPPPNNNNNSNNQTAIRYDVWAFGCLVYLLEVSNGVPLFPTNAEGTLSESARRHLQQWRGISSPVSSGRQSNTDKAWHLAHYCLHPDPNQRCSTMDEVLRQPYFTGEALPTSSLPLTPSQSKPYSTMSRPKQQPSPNNNNTNTNNNNNNTNLLLLSLKEEHESTQRELAKLRREHESTQRELDKLKRPAVSTSKSNTHSNNKPNPNNNHNNNYNTLRDELTLLKTRLKRSQEDHRATQRSWEQTQQRLEDHCRDLKDRHAQHVSELQQSHAHTLLSDQEQLQTRHDRVLQQLDQLTEEHDVTVREYQGLQQVHLETKRILLGLQQEVEHYKERERELELMHPSSTGSSSHPSNLETNHHTPHRRRHKKHSHPNSPDTARCLPMFHH